MTTARWNGTVLALSDRTVVVEGNHYFPPDAVDFRYFQASATTTRCPWKGDARYYSVNVGGTVNPDAAWTYPEPNPAAANIRGYVAFAPGVDLTA